MIDILLATYNGEKYIEQQLLSLIGQTVKEWKCYIHDDGSTDRTVGIVRKYCKIDSRFILEDDSIKFHSLNKIVLHF